MSDTHELQPDPSAAPPPAATAAPASGWPSSAKATSGVLAIVAVIAIILAIVGLAGSDDDEAEAALAAANDRAAAAEAERDDLADQLEAVEEGESAAIAEATAELETARADLAQSTADLEAVTTRAEEAEARIAEIEEIAGQFPIGLDSSLIPDDMPGTYSIEFEEAYCDPGFVLCGTVPSQNVAEIYFDDNEFLRIRVDGVLDAGLFALEGSLYGITDTIGAVSSCSATDRRARITMTMFAGSVSVLEDGTRVVNDISASINLDAPPDGEGCPGGVQFFSSTLTKQS
jgi:type II secretory pathway pseudopilin PulG